MGFETHNCIANSGSMFFYQATELTIVALIILFGFCYKYTFNDQSKDKFRKFAERYMFNGIFILYYEGWTDIVISS